MFGVRIGFGDDAGLRCLSGHIRTFARLEEAERWALELVRRLESRLGTRASGHFALIERIDPPQWVETVAPFLHTQR